MLFTMLVTVADVDGDPLRLPACEGMAVAPASRKPRTLRQAVRAAT
jgi:hypothetical protein